MNVLTDKQSGQGLQMRLSQIADLLTTEYAGDDVEVLGVCTDTRKLIPGQLFVALKGPNFDGHNFVKQASEQGAAACLVEHAIDGVNQVIVEDTRQALGELARLWRQKLSLKLVGVTGSNGKTTVKEMLAAIFSVEGKVLATRGNLNNDIGMPLTLLELDENHDFAVIEMGANHHGEIAYLTNIAKPDVALITNAGMAHLEGFGSVEGVSRAKGEIYQGLGNEGIAIINNDDNYASYWKELNAGRKIISFGLGHSADVWADIEMRNTGQQLNINTAEGQVSVNLNLLGKHNAMNALAATSAAIATGIGLSSVKAGLEKLQPVNGRLQLKKGIKGSRVIDDTYNANPTSLYAALDVLSEFPGKHFLALGDMGELGDDAVAIHADVGLQARKNGVNKLYSLGALANHAAKTFGDSSYIFNDHESMINQITQDLTKDVTLLVKGSRLMKMEKIIAACITGNDGHY